MAKGLALSLDIAVRSGVNFTSTILKAKGGKLHIFSEKKQNRNVKDENKTGKYTGEKSKNRVNDK